MAKNRRRQKKRKSWKNWLLNIAIILLVLVGLGLIFNKEIRNFVMAGTVNKLQVSNYSADQLAKNKANSTGDYNFKDVQSVNFNTVMKAMQNAQQLPTIGGIAVPEVGINLPIFAGVGNLQISAGAGTMKEEQVMGKKNGNYALASHHIIPGYFANGENMLFSPLDRAKTGMKIYLTDKAAVYEYKITSITYVDPSEVQVIDDVPGRTMITLVTCDDTGDKREIVQGDFVKKTTWNETDASVQKAFDKKYSQLPGFGN
ncbi:MAG: class A sortase [Streptococcaceae bacterium]|jgi:sortase A|nr:class A sortase [Streptococcaceae bacterium]